jgi:hypothetical protein
VTIEDAKLMSVWNDANPVPANALRTVEDVESALKKAQRCPTHKESKKKL